MFSLLGIVAFVAVAFFMLHCLWRPVRFVMLTGLGIVAIIGGVRMLAHEDVGLFVNHARRAVADEVRERREMRVSPRVVVDPGIRIERTENIVPKITVEPQIDVDTEDRWERFGGAFDFDRGDGAQHIAGEPSVLGKVALAGVLLIVGWLLVGGGSRGRALKVITVLGLVTGGVVLVSLFSMPHHSARVRNRDVVVRNGDDHPAVAPAAPRAPEAPRARVAKRPSRAKRPTSRPDRGETSEELLAQMPKRAGEIPVEAELSKASEPTAKAPEAPIEPQSPLSQTEPAAPANPTPAPAAPSEPSAPAEAEKPAPEKTPEPADPAPPIAEPAAATEPASPSESAVETPAKPVDAPSPTTPADAPPAAAPSATTPPATTPPPAAPEVPAAQAPSSPAPPAVVPTSTSVAPVAITRAADRPSWIDAPGRLDDTVYRIPVKSGPWVSVPECQRALDAAIKHEADQYINELLGEPGASNLVNVSRNYLREHVKKAEYNEVMQASVGPMHQIHALLEFDDDARATFHQRWRNAVVGERLVYAGTAAAAVLALLGTFYGYLRLDLKTGGAQKGRLQLAATLVALIVAATALLVRWVE